jgi:predicted amidohydrolase
MRIKVAAVQPRSHHAPEEERNIEQALSWMKRASEQGADLVVFPEGYPGPTNPASRYDSLAPLQDGARSLGVHVVAGRIEPITGAHGHHVCLSLIDDTGAVASTYRRTSPVGPYVYKDLDIWQVDYVEGAEPPQVVNTRLGRIGMLVCSEVYVPELSRVLALQGADVIVYPAGGAINELLGTWRTLLWARAIENLVFTVASQNLYAADEQGVGQIAAPERILAASPGEGLLLADLDLDRLEYLRGQDERIEFPKPYDAIPGVTRWRRPELYASLIEPAGERAPASAS